jgi:cell division protein FtsW
MQALRFDPAAVQRRPAWDELLLGLVAALSAGGFVMMGSASMDYAAEQFGNPFYHILRHGIYLGAGVLVLLATLRVPVALWQQASQPLLVSGLLLLAVLLVPGIGREVNGATRWIGFGLFNVQPSELMKLFFVVYLASYIPRRGEELQRRMLGMLKPLALLGLVLVLLLLEPDFGAAVVIAGTTFGMLFVGGARLLPFIAILAMGLFGAGLLAIASPYRMQRLVTYLDPWADQFSSGYQLTQALIAFGRGELFGVGLGNSVQKLFYLPEAHTDFVFAIVAEELGLVGCVLFIGLFAALVARILWIARAAAQRQQLFAAHACVGVALLVAAQVFINIGVNAGLLPTKGLTLPFLSYGGSSLLILFAMMGLVARIEHETRLPAAASAGAFAGWRLRHG